MQPSKLEDGSSARLVDLIADIAEPQHDSSFHEFVAKILWLGWGSEELQTFFVSDGLHILGKLFAVQSTAARTYTALMLAVLLANGLLDERKRQSAEQGINGLIEELEPLVLCGQARPLQPGEAPPSEDDPNCEPRLFEGFRRKPLRDLPRREDGQYQLSSYSTVVDQDSEELKKTHTRQVVVFDRSRPIDK